MKGDRHFTYHEGKFKDCRGVKFTADSGWCFFVRNDLTEVRTSMWSIQDAERNVETGHWVEVSQDFIYGTLQDAPSTPAAGAGAW